MAYMKVNVFQQKGPKDSGTTAPQLKGGAKASYRSGENAADRRMHTSGANSPTNAGRADPAGPGKGPMSRTGATFPAGIGRNPGVGNPGVRHPEERGTMANGSNPKPTKQLSMSAGGASAGAERSGMERAMGALADSKHPVKRR